MISPSASREYKKARRQHWKSTKNRPVNVDAGWSPFRAVEKKYKARFPPPDLSAVLDLNADPPTLHRPVRISAKGSDLFVLPDVPGARASCQHGVALTCPTLRTGSPARICLSARSTSPRQMVTSRPRAPAKRNEPRRPLRPPVTRRLECPPPIPPCRYRIAAHPSEGFPRMRISPPILVFRSTTAHLQ